MADGDSCIKTTYSANIGCCCIALHKNARRGNLTNCFFQPQKQPASKPHEGLPWLHYSQFYIWDYVEIGQRLAQHRNAIDAARRAGVSLLAYTSLLHADTSPLGLAGEHVATEASLAQAGVPFVLLRNGWYTENYLASIPPALQHGAVGHRGRA